METEVYYRLARSVVNISGKVTADFDPRTSKPRRTATSDIAIGVGADPRLDWRARLPMHNDFLKSKTFEIAFTPDGRLASSSASTAGAGASILEAGVRVAGLVAAAVTRAAPGARGGDRAPEPPSIEATFKSEQPALHARREAYRTAITKLQDKLAEHGAAVATAEPSEALIIRGRTIQATLEQTRAEADRVQAEIDVWRAARFPSAVESHQFAIGTDELPQLPSATPTATFEELRPAVAEAERALGIVVARVADVEEDANNVVPDDLRKANGIFFRVARPVKLAVYTRLVGTKDAFELGSVTPGWVVDSDSRMGFVNFDSAIFGREQAKITFGDTGALSALSSESESAAKQLSEALSAAPGQFTESLEQAVKASDALGKLSAADAEQELAAIERRRKILEAEIAEKGVLATRWDREALERLKVYADAAEQRKKLRPAAESPTKPIEDELAKVKLDVELRKLQIELAGLPAKPGG